MYSAWKFPKISDFILDLHWIKWKEYLKINDNKKSKAKKKKFFLEEPEENSCHTVHLKELQLLFLEQEN